MQSPTNMASSITDEDSFIEELPEDLKCPICLQLLKDPVQTTCGHRFCAQCISHVYNLLCPIDRTELKRENIFPDNAVKMAINKLRVRCPYHKQGCKWEGDLSDKSAHLLMCEYSSRECGLCGEMLSLRIYETHKGVCPNREVRCQDCGILMPHSQSIQHRVVCPKFPIPCPNDCPDSPIARDEMSGHLMNTCPNQSVACTLAAFGCSEMVQRCSLDTHLQQCSIKRVVALAEIVLQQKDELQRLRQEISRQQFAVRGLEETCYPAFGQFTWRVCSIREKVIRAQSAPSDPSVAALYSPSFYTSEGGYKLCLCIYPAGDNNQHCLSLYFVVMKGPYDSILQWPFQKRVILSLINCRGGHPIIKDIIPDGRLHYFSRPRDERNVGYGYPKFIPLHKLMGEDSEFVSEDCIFIRAVAYN